MALRDLIKSADDLKRLPVDMTEEWGCTVYVRALSGLDRIKAANIFEDARKNETAETELQAMGQFLILTVCEADGSPVFTSNDLELLLAKAATALKKVFNVAIDLNKMRDGEIEEAKKN